MYSPVGVGVALALVEESAWARGPGLDSETGSD